MQKITVKAEYCYGIPKLEHEFDFTNNNTPIALYAPNGLMKTSLAKSAKDYSQGNMPKDEIYPDRNSIFELLDENGRSIPRESIFVVDSLNERYQSERISTLLASADLKAQYDVIFEDIGKKRDAFLSQLKKTSGVKRNIERVFTEDFGLPETQLLTALARLEREVKSGANREFGEFEYKVLVNDKVEAFISKPDFADLIREYSETYERIIDNSKYFKKGVFNHSNAELIAKNLKSNGWFEGGHTVQLNDGNTGLKIENEKQLEEAIEAEKLAILNNSELQSTFTKVDKALSNAELRLLRDYLVENPTLLPELSNYQYLKNKLWVGYLQKLEGEYLELVQAYDESEAKLKDIIVQAEAEQTKWEVVLGIFNARFSVPFKIAIENKGDAVLNINSPQIAFYFNDEWAEASDKKVERRLLDEVLSNGEKRALYILNIIFEVEARRGSGIETLFLIDDIADSFDYKNKYAIVEYLSDMRQEANFHLLIMTHNFDFYRTIRSRLSVYGENKVLATRESGGIYIRPDNLSQNPFMEWRDNLDNHEYIIASIPFVRNLAQYVGDEDSNLKLTSLLHIKATSSGITISDLKVIYEQILSSSATESMPEDSTSVLDVIFQVCTRLSSRQDECLSLHAKVVLAIGIRLRAEGLLIHLIANDDYVASITKNQTGKLIRKYETQCPDNVDTINVMRKVSLMTPENIHLNSFMFEPILDMSAVHLQNLYSDVTRLAATYEI